MSIMDKIEPYKNPLTVKSKTPKKRSAKAFFVVKASYDSTIGEI